MRGVVPYPIRRPLRTGLGWLRWGSQTLLRHSDRGRIRVYYGHDSIPDSGRVSHGGMVKLHHLQESFPSSPWNFNLLYMVSSALSRDAAPLLWLLKKRDLRLVWNQNGVGYLGWHGPRWEKVNEPMARMLHAADHVFYQSRFCKLSADKFLGKRDGSWQILYNAVDTRVFTPPALDPDTKHLELLSVGSFQSFYRFESAVKTLKRVARHRKDVKLVIAGRLVWDPDHKRTLTAAHRLIDELGVRDNVTLLPPYSQKEAPSIFQHANILLHTKYNDPCPTTVIEAMASGLPVVYSASGGVPELVGIEAGIGVPGKLNWEKEIPPDAQLMAEAVLKIAERREQYAEAARQRTVERFDIRSWLEAHREVFESV